MKILAIIACWIKVIVFIVAGIVLVFDDLYLTFDFVLSEEFELAFSFSIPLSIFGYLLLIPCIWFIPSAIRLSLCFSPNYRADGAFKWYILVCVSFLAGVFLFCSKDVPAPQPKPKKQNE